MELSGLTEKFSGEGFSVVVLSNESRDQQNRFMTKYKINYSMLSDPQSKVINQFGLLNESMPTGTKYYGVPYPGVFVVDADDKIAFKFAEENYRDRPIWDDILKAVQAINGTLPLPQQTIIN